MPISLKTLMGGGVVPIGGVIQLAVQTGKALVTIDGATYLESGFVLRGEAANYPEAAALMTPNYSSVVASTVSGIGNAYAAAYGNGTFVVLGGLANKSLTSTDGLTWSENTTTLSASEPNTLAFGAGKFVSCAGGYSTNGVAWTAKTGMTRYVRFLNNKFVSFGHSGVVVSTDGVTWGTNIQIAGISTLRDATYANGKYIVVGDLGKVAASTDLVNWTVYSTPATTQLTGVAFGAGRFITISATNAYTSTDGVTWSKISTVDGVTSYGNGGNGGNGGIEFIENKFILSCGGGTGIYYTLISDDGISWYTTSLNPLFQQTGYIPAYASDKRILVYPNDKGSYQLNTFFLDQIGIPERTVFGDRLGASGSITTTKISDYVRIK